MRLLVEESLQNGTWFKSVRTLLYCLLERLLEVYFIAYVLPIMNFPGDYVMKKAVPITKFLIIISLSENEQKFAFGNFQV